MMTTAQTAPATPTTAIAQIACALGLTEMEVIESELESLTNGYLAIWDLSPEAQMIASQMGYCPDI
ncbi:MAG: hypothetical protein HQL05_03800 [Nitrospirae bacterium]|uniref:hypothetical protein n=1 Tax=Candidatus Magnetobacterium casense TaxID=1455061 RepID=UPI00058E360F|nr:hypothetical protein [Candidatus Magnetobacterium casensis]MBF0336933.1 hypothetical protein [Nitrospirota bacterium]